MITELILACLKIDQVGPYNVRKFMETVNEVTFPLFSFEFMRQSKIRPIQRAIEKGLLTEKIWDQYTSMALAEIIVAKASNMEIINYLSPRYPQELLKLDSYPAIIYAHGNIDLLNAQHSVAIVGNREPSESAISDAKRITKHFVERDHVIVSGLAQGCDTVAHQTALDNQGKTIAILAAGLDQPVYPQQNAKLAQAILDNDGLLISTYPLGTKLFPKYLAARDEWQSGLSQGVIAMENNKDDGTNITMKFAQHQQRPLAYASDLKTEQDLAEFANQMS